MINRMITVIALLMTSYTSAASHIDERTTPKTESIERIEVLGERPLRFYLKEYRRQENAFYDMFNDLINDSEMQIHCTRVKQFNSNMRKRVCAPRFVGNIDREMTQRGLRMRNVGGIGERLSQISFGAVRAANFEHSERAALIKEKNTKLADELQTLLDTHPELYEQYVKLRQAKTNYDNRLKSE